MSKFSPSAWGKSVQEFADILQMHSHVEALQEGHKILMQTLGRLDERVREIELGLRELRFELKFEALKETQQAINAVQGDVNKRMEEMAIRVAMIERELSNFTRMTTATRYIPDAQPELPSVVEDGDQSDQVA